MKQPGRSTGVDGNIPVIADVYPDRAQYLQGEEVCITVELMNPGNSIADITAVLTITRLDAIEYRFEKILQLVPLEEKTESFRFTPEGSEWSGYGADLGIFAGNVRAGGMSTSFDIVSSWKKAIRYGFLCDFYKTDENDSEDVKQMAKYHLNTVQFYDWMYKHEELFPEADRFTDPLGRELSLSAVKKKITACHRYGMKALAYCAVYGASQDFFEEHSEWALYDNDGKAEELGNWLVIMNTSPDSPWTGHIVKEFRKVMEVTEFDGVHLDTYGFPKTAYSKLDGRLRLERLESHFPELIDTTRKALEGMRKDLGLTFNSVNNWPVAKVAAAGLDAVYVEVWDPNERYWHLHQIICNAREKGGGKPVVLAAYLKAFAGAEGRGRRQAWNCFLLTSAVIFANGGYHLLLGEYNGLLTEGYFVKYSIIHKEFERHVRDYYDFIVRYANLLYDPQLEELSMTHANGLNDEFLFHNADFSSYGEPGKVWTIVRERPGYVVISLINLKGIKSDKWNEGKNPPIPVENIMVEALICEDVEGVFLASPDIDGGISQKLEFTLARKEHGLYTVFSVPELRIWDMIYIKKRLTRSCG